MHHHAAGFGPSADYTPLDTEDYDGVAGGYARIATVIRQIRVEQAQQGIPVLVVDSGDFFMGSVYDLAYRKPLALKFFKHMQYDALTLGNHEFDWRPQGLADLFNFGIDDGFNTPVIASNLVLDATDPDDDGLEALFDSGAMSQTASLILSNGIKVGILGILGQDADSKSPAAEPCTFNHDKAALQQLVDSLRSDQGADIVLLLSHSGIMPDGTGEDVSLAEDMRGIDIIASGHEHTASATEIISSNGNTIIFSPGEYGKTICRLDVVYNTTRNIIESHSFSLIPIGDHIEGNAAVHDLVMTQKQQIDTLLAPLGVGTDTEVSRTSFPLEMIPLTETALGNVAADAIRDTANQKISEDENASYQLAVVASGVVRDFLYPGKTGVIRFEDIYNVLPVGTRSSQDDLPGHALMSIYVKAKDIKNICEVAISLAPLVDTDIYLHFSGIKFTYDPGAFIFNRVKEIYLCGPADPYTENATTLLDLSDSQTLYRMAVNQYAFELMAYTSFFGLPIVARDRNGNVIDPVDRESHFIDASPDSGRQNLFEWMALYEFLAVHFPVDGEGISQSLYGESGSAMGRITKSEP